MNVKGQVAIVTGGASGLGGATASALAAAGAKVAIFDLQDELGEAVEGIAAVPFLRAQAVCGQHQPAVLRQTPSCQHSQPPAPRLIEQRRGGGSKAQLQRAGHLVDVLPTGTR